MSIIITDPELVQILEEQAKTHNSTVEDMLRKAFIDTQKPPAYIPHPKDEEVRDIYLKAYAKARDYWQSVGDMEKATLTDDDLDVHFGAFDENGIPRLKHELSQEPPIGSLAYAGKLSQEANIHTNVIFDASKSDDILDEELAEEILKRS
ncbi:MAG TPA: hypothetical protein PLZ51_09165, partial [Aggregatilineales bacterium]|nr:hypothetical protein [Aggregatilineales bacterium]